MNLRHRSLPRYVTENREMKIEFRIGSVFKKKRVRLINLIHKFKLLSNIVPHLPLQ